MRPEDKGGPSYISGEGRGPLDFGEREALKRQRENREGDSLTHADNERYRMQALHDDPGGVKRPRFLGAPWVKDPRGQ